MLLKLGVFIFSHVAIGNLLSRTDLGVFHLFDGDRKVPAWPEGVNIML